MNRSFHVAPLALALSLALFSTVHAEEQAPEAAPAPQDSYFVLLDRMEVTAQKREQQVEDVPIAITAFSGSFMENLGIDGFEQLGSFVPGLQTQVQSPNNPGFVIRGISSSSGEAHVEPRVSVFQDGVSISRSRGSVVELYDLERVEVLRGPQGTLFGRSAQVGALHLIQNKARNETSGSFRGGFGNFNETFFSGHLNAPLYEDNLYGRVAVYHQKRDGVIGNLSGGDIAGRDTQAARASFRLDLGQWSGLDLILNYQKDTPPATPFRSANIPTRAGTTTVFDAPADFNRGAELGLDRTVRGATLLGDFRLSTDWTLSTITGWRDFKAHEEFDADGSQVYLLEFAELAKGRQFSQEARFNYDGGGNFRGFLGGSWFDETGSQRVPFSTDERSLYALLSPLLSELTGGGLPVVPLLNPDATPNTSVSVIQVPVHLQQMLGLPAALPLKSMHSEEYANFGDVRALELFADGTWTLNQRADLTLGVRYTREKVTSGYEALYYGTPSVMGLFLQDFPDNVAFPNALFLPTAGRLSGSDTFSSLVGRAVLGYRFSDHVNGYAGISRGRRPDVIQVDAGGAEMIDAEIVWNYEVGLKGEAGNGRFLYDVSAFYYDYSNFQTKVENPNPPPFFITANGGNAHAFGVEVSLINRFSNNFSGFLNYGWIDASFNAVDGSGTPQELAGNRFRLTPEHTLAVGLDWRVGFGSGHNFYFRPTYSWRSRVYFEDDNVPEFSQGAYGLLNVNTGVAMSNGWDIQAYAHNLTDEKYLIDGGNTGALFGIPTYNPGLPRTYGVRFAWRF